MLSSHYGRAARSLAGIPNLLLATATLTRWAGDDDGNGRISCPEARAHGIMSVYAGD